MNFVTITFFKRPLGIAFLASMLLNPAASGEPETGWAGKDFGKVPSPVNPGAVTIEGKTEIKWMPEAFKFTPGASVRYVDFENGDDANAGTSKEQPWKHHPWDARAVGKAADGNGNHTYVFKGGVVYRGNLVAGESGTEAEPIRLLQHFESGKLKKVFDAGRDGIYRAHLPLLPNGKTDVNDTPHAPVRLSMPDINDAYPEATHEQRQETIRAHQYYNVGLLDFLQHDDAVPAAVREDARSWGWCRDEFIGTAGLPPQLYIREARRMVGQRVFTGNDTAQLPDDARGVLHRDAIAIGDYVHNCHGTGREGSRYEGTHSGEFYKPVPPYQIAAGVIIPQKTANLLVPVACSASQSPCRSRSPAYPGAPPTLAGNHSASLADFPVTRIEWIRAAHAIAHGDGTNPDRRSPE